MTKKQKKTLKRIIAAAVLTVLLALLFHFVELPWFVQLVLWLVPYLVIGHDVLRKAFMGIKNGEVFDENFLMAVATVGAIGCGEYAEGVAVMLFYQIGELFQSYAVGKSRSSITALMDIRPDSANLEAGDGSVSIVDPDDVPIGATIVVKPGEKIPLDGVVLTGESTLNTAALTGESRPRTVRPGDEVISGCVNADGVLRIRTTKIYGESTVAKILDLVENSSLKKAPVENFITKFARYYTPAVCIGALVLAVVPPLLLGNWLQLAYNAVDSIIAGRFIGQDALAAEGIAGPVMNLVILAVSGLCIGAGVLMSEAFGAKNEGRLKETLATTLLFGAALCCAVALLGVAAAPLILHSLAVPNEILHSTGIYLRITFLGAPFTFFYNALAAGLKSVGDSKTPLKFLAFSAVLNAVLDIVLIGGLGFGIVCSAVTTVVAEAASAIMAVRVSGIIISRNV